MRHSRLSTDQLERLAAAYRVNEREAEKFVDAKNAPAYREAQARFAEVCEELIDRRVGEV